MAATATALTAASATAPTDRRGFLLLLPKL